MSITLRFTKKHTNNVVYSAVIDIENNGEIESINIFEITCKPEDKGAFLEKFQLLYITQNLTDTGHPLQIAQVEVPFAVVVITQQYSNGFNTLNLSLDKAAYQAGAIAFFKELLEKGEDTGDDSVHQYWPFGVVESDKGSMKVKFSITKDVITEAMMKPEWEKFCYDDFMYIREHMQQNAIDSTEKDATSASSAVDEWKNVKSASASGHTLVSEKVEEYQASMDKAATGESSAAHNAPNTMSASSADQSLFSGHTVKYGPFTKNVTTSASSAVDEWKNVKSHFFSDQSLAVHYAPLKNSENFADEDLARVVSNQKLILQLTGKFEGYVYTAVMRIDEDGKLNSINVYSITNSRFKELGESADYYVEDTIYNGRHTKMLNNLDDRIKQLRKDFEQCKTDYPQHEDGIYNIMLKHGVDLKASSKQIEDGIKKQLDGGAINDFDDIVASYLNGITQEFVQEGLGVINPYRKYIGSTIYTPPSIVNITPYHTYKKLPNNNDIYTLNIATNDDTDGFSFVRALLAGNSIAPLFNVVSEEYDFIRITSKITPSVMGKLKEYCCAAKASSDWTSADYDDLSHVISCDEVRATGVDDETLPW